MTEKVRKIIQKACDIIELLAAVAVGLGLVYSVILYLPSGLALLSRSGDTADFLLFLEDMFSIVVGIEFIKMLCKPSPENVIEVLVFLISRHMIIESSSALDIFLSVLSVALLYGVRYALRLIRRRSKAPGQAREEAPEDASRL